MCTNVCAQWGLGVGTCAPACIWKLEKTCKLSWFSLFTIHVSPGSWTQFARLSWKGLLAIVLSHQPKSGLFFFFFLTQFNLHISTERRSCSNHKSKNLRPWPEGLEGRNQRHVAQLAIGVHPSEIEMGSWYHLFHIHFFFFFQTRSHSMVQAGLKLTKSFLCLPRARITHLCYHNDFLSTCQVCWVPVTSRHCWEIGHLSLWQNPWP